MIPLHIELFNLFAPLVFITGVATLLEKLHNKHQNKRINK